MPPPLRCAPPTHADASVGDSPVADGWMSPTQQLSKQMQAAALAHTHTPTAAPAQHSSAAADKENQYTSVFSFNINKVGQDGGATDAKKGAGTDAAAAAAAAARSQPPVAAAAAAAPASKANIDDDHSASTPRLPLHPLDTSSVHWRGGSLSLSLGSPLTSPLSSSSSSSSSGSGLSLGRGCPLLTNNSNLSNSFRKGNGKRCLTRAPLQDHAGNSVADYPHHAAQIAATNNSQDADSSATTTMRLHCPFPHAPLAAHESVQQQQKDGPPSTRAARPLQLHPLESLAFGSAAVAPLLPPASSFHHDHNNNDDDASALSSPINSSSGAQALRAPRFHDSPAGADANGAQMMSLEPEEHALAPLESVPRTPTPCSSPARQQLQFDSGDKSAPSSSSSSIGFRGVGLHSSSGVRASSGLRAPLSPLPLLDSPVVVRKAAERNSVGGGSQRLGLCGLRATPSRLSGGGLSARQQAMLASPALTIEVSTEPARSRFQIRSLAGLVGPVVSAAPRGASSMASGAAAPVPVLSTHEQESRREEEEMAINRRNAAAAAAAAAATTEAMGGSSSGAHSTTAQVERHRPKRARSIAASLFSSVAVDLAPTPSEPPASGCNGSTTSVAMDEGSASSTGVSPLLQSSSLVPSHGASSSASTVGLQSHSYSASTHLPLVLALSQSGRRSTPLLSRNLSSSSSSFSRSHLATHSEAASESESEASTPHCDSTSVSGALSPADQMMMAQHSSAAYAQQLLLSSALAEDRLLRTLAEAGSGFQGCGSSAAAAAAASVASSSSALPHSSASASPRCGGGASASPTPSPLDEEAFAGCWGLAPMATDAHSLMASPLAEEGEGEGVSLMEFIPTLPNVETAVAAPTSAPLRMQESTCAAVDVALGIRHHHHSSRRQHPDGAVSASGALSLQHRRGSTSMLGTALFDAGASFCRMSSFDSAAAHTQAQAAAAAAAAATAAVLLDESEDDAAECASALPPQSLCPSLSSAGSFVGASSSGVGVSAGSSGVLPGIVGGPCDVKRISPETMARLLAGDFQNDLDNFIVIDCRYDYEYTGGHIDGAINLNDRALLSKFFRVNSQLGARLAVVFHCEFSQNRAPKSYRFFRSLDRIRNAASYPSLSFPEIAVLDGGYKSFFHAHPDHCTPRNYVSMWDEAFQNECKEQTSIHRKSWGTGKAAPAHKHGHGHGHGHGSGAGGAAAAGAAGGAGGSRSLRRRSNTHVGLGLPGSGLPLMRAMSAVDLSSAGSTDAAAMGVTASPCGSSSPDHHRGSSLFSPVLAPSSSAACVGSPLPSFSLLSAASSPADAHAPARASGAGVSARASAAVSGSTHSACSSNASTPAGVPGGGGGAGARVVPISPLSFDIHISSPERDAAGPAHPAAPGHRSASM